MKHPDAPRLFGHHSPSPGAVRHHHDRRFSASAPGPRAHYYYCPVMPQHAVARRSPRTTRPGSSTFAEAARAGRPDIGARAIVSATAPGRRRSGRWSVHWSTRGPGRRPARRRCARAAGRARTQRGRSGSAAAADLQGWWWCRLASVRETNPTPRSPSSVMVASRCVVLRPSRSIRRTTTVSPGLARPEEPSQGGTLVQHPAGVG